MCGGTSGDNNVDTTTYPLIKSLFHRCNITILQYC